MTTNETLPLPASTYQLLLDAARTWPDGIATQWIPDPADHTRSLTWTYAELAGTVTRIANALTTLGVKRQDAVTLAGINTSMLYAATLAAQAAGIADPPHRIPGPGRGRARAGPAAVATAARGGPPGRDDRRPRAATRRRPRRPARPAPDR
jgi:acyl-coenzyme A synthetase/AMP-(fatty) acid ligase